MSSSMALGSAAPRRSKSLHTLSTLLRTPTKLLRTRTTVSRLKRPRSQTPSSPPSTPTNRCLPAVDLLSMSRAQLEGVVRALNERLPHRNANCARGRLPVGRRNEEESDLDGLSRMSETEMKRRIEEVVGIRTVMGKNRIPKLGLGVGIGMDVPPAPIAVRTRDAVWRPYEKAPWEIDVNVEWDNAQTRACELDDETEDALLGSSPLATRARVHSHSRRRRSMEPRLPILREENEMDEPKEDDCEEDDARGSKRRRVSPENSAETGRSRSEDDSGHVPTARVSRLIENMDVSASPLLAMEDEAPLDGSAQSSDAPPQRKPSARIQRNVLRRASSVKTGKATTANTERSKSLVRAKTFTSRRSRTENSEQTSGPAAEVVLPKRRFSVRLPFTSTPARVEPVSPPPLTPVVTHPHSQRLAAEYNPASSTQTKGTKVVAGDKGPRSSMLTPSGKLNSSSQSRHGTILHAEHESEKQEREKENEGPQALVAPSISPPAVKTTTRGLLAFPSVLANFLKPHPRLPSTSAVTSARGARIDVPSRFPVSKEMDGLQENTGVVPDDGRAGVPELRAWMWILHEWTGSRSGNLAIGDPVVSFLSYSGPDSVASWIVVFALHIYLLRDSVNIQ
ncbi:hypothetical protein BU15DRAFT_79930 [Melanogaster broomeanus]|nr:hypothetical protein BU15DRAFT_79930 [Melanogaster broomeanus]